MWLFYDLLESDIVLFSEGFVFLLAHPVMAVEQECFLESSS